MWVNMAKPSCPPRHRSPWAQEGVKTRELTHLPTSPTSSSCAHAGGALGPGVPQPPGPPPASGWQRCWGPCGRGGLARGGQDVQRAWPCWGASWGWEHHGTSCAWQREVGRAPGVSPGGVPHSGHQISWLSSKAIPKRWKAPSLPVFVWAEKYLWAPRSRMVRNNRRRHHRSEMQMQPPRYLGHCS